MKFDGYVDMNTLSALPTESGVYFLVSNTGEFLYVGKSINTRRRWMTHHRLTQAQSEEGCSLKWMLVPTDILDATESLYIKKFNPKWNKKASVKRKYVAVKVPPYTKRIAKIGAVATRMSMAEFIDSAVAGYLERNKDLFDADTLNKLE